jgi:hypothetical protein
MTFKDQDVTDAYTRLLDVTCIWERATGREITILVIPHNSDEIIGVSSSGKPWRENGIREILTALAIALEARGRAMEERG